MSEQWLLSFLIALVLVLISLFFRIQQGSWFSPGAFFALCWCILVLLPLLAAPDFEVNPLGILWILIAVFIVYFGSLIGSGRMLFKHVPSISQISFHRGLYYQLKYFNQELLSKIIIYFSIIGSISSIILILSTGRNIGAILSIKSLARIAREFSILRYSDLNYREPAMAILLFSFIYAAALFGGTLFAICSSYCYKLISLLPILPALLSAAVLTTRASIYFTAILWISAYFSASVITKKGILPFFRSRNIIFALISGSTIFFLIIILLMFRYGTINLNIKTLHTILDQVRVDLFGYLSSFSEWFSDNWQKKIIPEFGSYTLGGPLALLKIVKRKSFESVYIGASYTNIFTIYRQLIEDFTLIGSIVILFLIGVISGRAFHQIVFKNNVLYIPILAIFYDITLRGFTGGLFRYTNLFFAWCIFIIYFMVTKMAISTFSKWNKSI